MKHGTKSAFVRQYPNLSPAQIVALAQKKGIDLNVGAVASTRSYDAKRKSNGNGNGHTASILADLAPATNLGAVSVGQVIPFEQDFATIHRLVQRHGVEKTRELFDAYIVIRGEIRGEGA